METQIAYTLADLQALKRQWVEDQIPFVQNLAMVIATLGHDYTTGRRDFKRLEIDGITAYRSEVAGLYNPARQSGQIRTWIQVYKGDGLNPKTYQAATLLCQVMWTNHDPEPVYNNDFLFVPGDWQARFKALIPQAAQIIAARSNTKEETERRNLEKLLCIGVKV